ncbi:relaxase MobL [Ktedonobacter racemifer]|uniref:Relaxase/mobilization nuclease family protein n=1 Tax=Ktedonobacter racemifer DSM 44963 TaxID=485913 RepID=D6U8U3_KTERA|nr:relaxase MobL [Ktedonobacter racemifer]EFH79653.1 hypothetical protein Krac_0131 [Ktedonobacter racemifer DSM 44963]
MIVRGRYVSSKGSHRAALGHKLGGHLKYLQYRALGAEETREDRAIFSKAEDNVARPEVIKDVMDHAHYYAAYHKLILSPSENEPVGDWQEWTRAVMRDMEERQSKELRWYAVLHQNTDNPHVHVVIAGKGQSTDTGKESLVKIGKEDYEAMRESGRAHSDYEWLREQRQHVWEAEREAQRREREEHRALMRSLHTRVRTARSLIESTGEGLNRLARPVDDNPLLDDR